MSPEVNGLTSTSKESALSCTKACVEIPDFLVTFGSYKWINKSTAFNDSFLIFSGFIYGAEKMLTEELHKRGSQTQPASHAIACSFLMSCGDSDIAVSFVEWQSQLFTPTFSYHFWRASPLTQALAEVLISKHLFFCCYIKTWLLQVMVWSTVG